MRLFAIAVLAFALFVAAGTTSERAADNHGRPPSIRAAGRAPLTEPDRVASPVARSLVASLAANHTTTAEQPTQVVATVDGRDAAWWARRARSNGRTMRQRGHTIQRLHHVLAAAPTVHDAISLASTVYRIPRSTLDRKAWCESRYSPAARNPSGARGLYQFLPSTWRTTPFARFSPFDPFASALAAGWMHLVGRGGEWSCR